MYDIIIIGAGPAGLSSAIYAGRGALKTLVIEALSVGGQMNKTYEIDNYPGVFDNPDGIEMSSRMKKHAEKFNIEFTVETVKEIIDIDKEIKTVKTRKNTYETKTIIFATGANPRKLNVLGEDEFYGLGVSYCATCDGPFFKDKDTVVVGGGNTAFEEALFLSKFSKSVTIIHRRDKFKAAKTLVDNAVNNPKIKILSNYTVQEILGHKTMEKIIIKSTINDEIKELDADGLFIAIGVIPNSELAKKYVKVNEQGFIITDEFMNTNISGVYACGDVRNTPLRQIITAASDGAIATTSAINYIIG